MAMSSRDQLMMTNIVTERIYELQSRQKTTKKGSKFSLFKKKKNDDIILPSLYKRQDFIEYTKVNNPSGKKYNFLVSIIIVNRNGYEKLKILMDSLVKCNYYKNIEVILVDNGSTDNSKELFQSYGCHIPLRMVENKKNATFSKANNQGAAIAKGDYFVFLNNDIEVMDYWLDHLLDLHTKSKNIGAVGCRLIYPEIPEGCLNTGKSYLIQHAGIEFKEMNLDGVKRYKPFNEGNAQSPFKSEFNTNKKVLAVTAAALLVDAYKFNKVGGFDEDYNYGAEDVDFCLKLVKEGYENYYCAESILFHYEFGTQSNEDSSELRHRRERNWTIFNYKWTNFLSKKIVGIDNDLKANKIRINVPCPDAEREKWGDYHFAKSLNTNLIKKGYDAEVCTLEHWYDESDALFTITIRGKEKYYPDMCRINMMWNISRPTSISLSEYLNYNHCFIASIPWTNKLKSLSKYYYGNFHVNKFSILLQCTDDDIFIEHGGEKECDLLFVGINRNGMRKIISDLIPTKHNLHIYGPEWIDSPAKEYVKADYISNVELGKYYSSCKILLNDHWDDMIANGFISNRIYDGAACGCLVVSDYHRDIFEIFEGNVITYSDSKDLHKKIDYFLEDKETSTLLSKRAQTIVLSKHTFKNRVESIVTIMEGLIEN